MLMIDKMARAKAYTLFEGKTLEEFAQHHEYEHHEALGAWCNCMQAYDEVVECFGDMTPDVLNAYTLNLYN